MDAASGKAVSSAISLKRTLIPSVRVSLPYQTRCETDAASDNYMDYSSDGCMTEFTPGQADRMRLQLMFYRGIEYH